MSVRLYPGIPTSALTPSPDYYARFIATLGVKAGSRVKMRRVRVSVGSSVSLSDLLLQGMRILEGVDRISQGQIMGVSMVLGHFVKDEIISPEPLRSRHAFVIHKAEEGKKIHKTVIPWLKETVSDLDVEAIVKGTDWTNLCNISLGIDGKTIEMGYTPDFKHLTLKDTLPDEDDTVSYGDVKDDPSDGGVDGSN